MLARIRKNRQITLPAAVCKALGLKEGDLLEVCVRENVIVLAPKRVVDKDEAQ